MSSQEKNKDYNEGSQIIISKKEKFHYETGSSDNEQYPQETIDIRDEQSNQQFKQQNDEEEKFDEHLPPPNPILVKKCDDLQVKTALKFVFKFFVQDSNDEVEETYEKKLRQMAFLPGEEECSLSQYIDAQKHQLIYKRIDNSANNAIPYNNKKFFAGVFINIKKTFKDIKEMEIQNEKTIFDIMKEKTKNKSSFRDKIDNILQNKSDSETQTSKMGLLQQIPQIPFINLPQKPELQNQNQQILQDPQYINQNINSSPSKKDKSQSQQSQQISQQNNQSPVKERVVQEAKELPIKDLIFDSNFESANLFCAYKVNDKEYELILNNDINSKGNTQWFFFSVSSTTKNSQIKFNIINLLKNDSLFNYGMRPVILSEKKRDAQGEDWFRGCSNITYTKNNIPRENGNSSYYTLSFTYKFEYNDDKVFFAHCFPYTYQQLNNYLNKLTLDIQKKPFLKRSRLCLTPGKLTCELITITAPEEDPKIAQKKKYIIIMARQHPGETPGSFIMEGMLDFLTDNKNEEAKYLRSTCIFKIIPMMNPDGVIHGNYRCSLCGNDLNRQWESPSKEFHPTVYWTKHLIQQLCNEKKEIRMILDLHGHSKKMNSFFYGNPNDEDPNIPRNFPLLASQINQDISFKSSTFKLTSDKQCTMRQTLFEQLFNNYIYTFEASFFGSTRTINDKKHFTISDFKNLGRTLCLTLQKTLQRDVQALQQDNQKLPKIITQVSDIQSSNSQKQLSQRIETNATNSSSSNNNNNQNNLNTETNIQIEDESFGSDSDPSEDELTKREFKSLLQNKKKLKQQQQNSQLEMAANGENDILKNTQNDENQTENPQKLSQNLRKSQIKLTLKEDKYIQTESYIDFSLLDEIILNESYLFKSSTSINNHNMKNQMKSLQQQQQQQQQNYNPKNTPLDSKSNSRPFSNRQSTTPLPSITNSNPMSSNSSNFQSNQLQNYSNLFEPYQSFKSIYQNQIKKSDSKQLQKDSQNIFINQIGFYCVDNKFSHNNVQNYNINVTNLNINQQILKEFSDTGPVIQTMQYNIRQREDKRRSNTNTNGSTLALPNTNNTLSQQMKTNSPNTVVLKSEMQADQSTQTIISLPPENLGEESNKLLPINKAVSVKDYDKVNNNNQRSKFENASEQSKLSNKNTYINTKTSKKLHSQIQEDLSKRNHSSTINSNNNNNIFQNNNTNINTSRMYQQNGEIYHATNLNITPKGTGQGHYSQFQQYQNSNQVKEQYLKEKNIFVDSTALYNSLRISKIQVNNINTNANINTQRVQNKKNSQNKQKFDGFGTQGKFDNFGNQGKFDGYGTIQGKFQINPTTQPSQNSPRNFQNQIDFQQVQVLPNNQPAQSNILGGGDQQGQSFYITKTRKIYKRELEQMNDKVIRIINQTSRDYSQPRTSLPGKQKSTQSSIHQNQNVNDQSNVKIQNQDNVGINSNTNNNNSSNFTGVINNNISIIGNNNNINIINNYNNYPPTNTNNSNNNNNNNKNNNNNNSNNNSNQIQNQNNNSSVPIQNVTNNSNITQASFNNRFDILNSNVDSKNKIQEIYRKNQISYSMRHAHNSRQVRKLYSVPFHKRFLEKLLTQQQQFPTNQQQ